MSEPARLNDEEQLTYLVNAIHELAAVLKTREQALGSAEAATERTEHLRHIAAAAGSMRSASWSLTNLAMTLAERPAKRRP